ncbi:MAG TPA: ketohydroxyglutarate aldolase [Nostocaceae cyanobacterium]|nr:ketohydroxyglutarate aldolase [Nostocaceae cyanobacterium]
MSNVNLTVAVEENYMSQILEVAENLRSTGMNVEQILDQIGVISGSCDSDKMQDITQVPGVSHVEIDREYQLPPPDSDLQ